MRKKKDLGYKEMERVKERRRKEENSRKFEKISFSYDEEEDDV